MAHGTDVKAIVDSSGYENDWHKFVEVLAILLVQGHIDREISDHFTGKSVTWVGRITALDLTRELTQGISLGMNTPHVGMTDGRHIKANHIVLHFRDNIPEGWAKCSVGDLVKFKANFKENSGVQPAIILPQREGKKSIVIRLGLQKGTLLEVMDG